MNTQLNPVQAYPFAWLDELIEVTLHPSRLQLKSLTAKYLTEIGQQLDSEARHIEYSLKAQTFGLNNKTDIQTIVAQYYFSVLHLHRLAAENLEAYRHNLRLADTGEAIMQALEELKQRITLRYAAYLPEQDQALPVMLVKLLIKLSGDQIGIVAKAAFQAGLIPAKSLRQAFRLLAPHLCTERKTELSPESMRSNSGRAEKTDLDSVLEHLHRITEIVKGYYRRR